MDEKKVGIFSFADSLVDLEELSGIGRVRPLTTGVYEFTVYGFEVQFKAGGSLLYESRDKKEIVTWHQRIKHAWGSYRGYMPYAEISTLTALPPEVSTSEAQPYSVPEDQPRPLEARAREVDPSPQTEEGSGQEEVSPSPYTLLR